MGERKIELQPERGAKCVDCGAPAAGIRPNLDQEPSCRRCEAERLAMIEILIGAAGDDVDDVDRAVTPRQGSLFGG